MWKDVLNKGGVFFILILVALHFFLWKVSKSVSTYRQKAEILEMTIDELNKEIEYNKIRFNDSLSLYQAEVKSLYMTKENLQARYEGLLAASKVKPKDVNSVTEIESIIHSKDTVIAYVDSFGGIKSRLKDTFVTIDVDVTPERQSIIEYQIRDSLTLLSIQKKHSWLFGLIKWKEQKGVKVINHNPKATIVSLQTIEILE